MIEQIGDSVWQCGKCHKVYVDRIKKAPHYCCGKLLFKRYDYTEMLNEEKE